MGTSPSLGPVVVGVDGSPSADRAVDWAADYAALTHRRLVAVHGTGFVGVRPSAHDLLEAERVALEAGRIIGDAAVERARRRHPELDVTPLVDVADPPTILLEQSRSAAAVVVGARREEAFKQLFGSVSLGVARHALCPAIVVRPPGHRAPGPMVDHIVLGLDGTATSRDAAAFAFEYAALTGLPLVVVHGSWDRLARGSAVISLLTEAEARGLTDEEELSIAETVAGLPERYPEVEVREEHHSGDPAVALVEASQTAKLVVVGARGLGAARAVLLRSVSTALVEHAACPVAVLHAHQDR